MLFKYKILLLVVTHEQNTAKIVGPLTPLEHQSYFLKNEIMSFVATDGSRDYHTK